MLRLSEQKLVDSRMALGSIPEGKMLINTINAHSYNVAQKDEAFAKALDTSYLNVNEGRCKREEGRENEGWKYLIPDGGSIVKACRWLRAKSLPKERIAGWDLFAFEMQRQNEKGESGKGKCRVMFMGSSEKVLGLIRERAAEDYPNLEVVTYSPPYRAMFSDKENREIIEAINSARPDLLWIGMTAPKQEKWTYEHWKELDVDCHVGTIGAVFDFYAGTARRAPLWMQAHSLEWFYRLMVEPKRMWRRYMIGNPLFIWNIMKEKRYGK